MVPFVPLAFGVIGGLICFGGALVASRTYATEQAALKAEQEGKQLLLRNLDSANERHALTSRLSS